MWYFVPKELLRKQGDRGFEESPAVERGSKERAPQTQGGFQQKIATGVLVQSGEQRLRPWTHFLAELRLLRKEGAYRLFEERRLSEVQREEWGHHGIRSSKRPLLRAARLFWKRLSYCCPFWAFLTQRQQPGEFRKVVILSDKNVGLQAEAGQSEEDRGNA